MSVHSSCVNVTGLCVRIQHLMNINHGGFPSLGMQLTIAWICMRWSCSLLVDWVSHESHGDSCRGLWCSGLYIATCLSQQALSIPSCIRSALTRWHYSSLSSPVLFSFWSWMPIWTGVWIKSLWFSCLKMATFIAFTRGFLPHFGSHIIIAILPTWCNIFTRSQW